MAEHAEYAGWSAERRLRQIIRARMLGALEGGWASLPPAEVAAQLEAVAARFDEGLTQFDDPICRGVYAALNHDPEQAEVFADLVAAQRLPADQIPASPIVDIDRILRGQAAAPPPVSLLVSLARRLGSSVAATRAWLERGQPVLPSPRPPDVVALRSSTADEADDAALPVLVTAVTPVAAGTGADVAFQVEAQPDGRWRVTVEVRQPETAAPAAGAWHVAAAVDERPVDGQWREPGLWEVSELLSGPELAGLTVRLRPAG